MMAYSDEEDGDHDNNGIEMKTTSRAIPTDDNDLELFEDEDFTRTMEPLPLVQRQNRCFLRTVGVGVLFAAVITVGMIYLYEPEALEGDKDSGVLSEEFNGAKDAENHQVVSRDYSNTSPFSTKPFQDKNAQGKKSKHQPGGAGAARHHSKFGNDANTMRDKHNQQKQNQHGHNGDGNGLRPGKHNFGGNPHSGQHGSGNIGNGGDEKSICDFSAHADWLAATVTLDDGDMYEVVDQFSHDHQAFVQGLTYADGVLWESNGLYGESTVRILDPKTIDVIKSVDMPKEVFGEGMAYVEGLLYQLSWKSKRGFIYNATTLDVMNEFDFHTTKNQGWGITWDPCGKEFIVTDGSANLHFWDRKTLSQTRIVPVTRMNGKPARSLNEIEWYRGRILANVWFEDVLLVIDPSTGTVEKEYDFQTLFPKVERQKLKCDVFNGISVSEDEDILYVTGKKWDRMFKVRLLV